MGVLVGKEVVYSACVERTGSSNDTVHLCLCVCMCVCVCVCVCVLVNMQVCMFAHTHTHRISLVQQEFTEVGTILHNEQL